MGMVAISKKTGGPSFCLPDPHSSPTWGMQHRMNWSQCKPTTTGHIYHSHWQQWHNHTQISQTPLLNNNRDIKINLGSNEASFPNLRNINDSREALHLKGILLFQYVWIYVHTPRHHPQSQNASLPMCQLLKLSTCTHGVTLSFSS